LLFISIAAKVRYVRIKYRCLTYYTSDISTPQLHDKTAEKLKSTNLV